MHAFDLDQFVIVTAPPEEMPKMARTHAGQRGQIVEIVVLEHVYFKVLFPDGAVLAYLAEELTLAQDQL